MGPLWGLRGWVLALALAISGVQTLNASINPEIMTDTGQVLWPQGPAFSLDVPKTTSTGQGRGNRGSGSFGLAYNCEAARAARIQTQLRGIQF